MEKILKKIDKVVEAAIRYFDYYPQRLLTLKLIASFLAGGVVIMAVIPGFILLLRWLFDEPLANGLILALISAAFTAVIFSGNPVNRFRRRKDFYDTVNRVKGRR